MKWTDLWPKLIETFATWLGSQKSAPPVPEIPRAPVKKVGKQVN